MNNLKIVRSFYIQVYEKKTSLLFIIELKIIENCLLNACDF